MQYECGICVLVDNLSITSYCRAAYVDGRGGRGERKTVEQRRGAITAHMPWRSKIAL